MSLYLLCNALKFNPYFLWSFLQKLKILSNNNWFYFSVWSCTEKTQYRKLETNIPRKGTARSQSQFLHSCFCERFIYSQERSAYILLQENRWTDRGNIYVHRSLTDTLMWEETRTEVAQFLFWENINRNFFAVWPESAVHAVKRIYICTLLT